jgi:hypothetical protein
MLLYHIKNPVTGEEVHVMVNNEEEEQDIRMYMAVMGWELLEIEEA